GGGQVGGQVVRVHRRDGHVQGVEVQAADLVLVRADVGRVAQVHEDVGGEGLRAGRLQDKSRLIEIEAEVHHARGEREAGQGDRVSSNGPAAHGLPRLSIQLATDPSAVRFAGKEVAGTSSRETLGSPARPQNSREAPDLEVSVPSARQGAPTNARERTRTSMEATALWTQWRRLPSGFAYCTCTIVSGAERTTPSMARRASRAAKCQVGGAACETVSGIQGSSPKRCTAPRKRSANIGNRAPSGPSTSSRSIDASGSSANAEQRAHDHAGQYERPHRCPCAAGTRCTSKILSSTSTASLMVVAECGSTYPFPRRRAMGAIHAGTISSAESPWPNVNRQRSACPSASASPAHPAAVSSASPKRTAPRLLEPARRDGRLHRPRARHLHRVAEPEAVARPAVARRDEPGLVEAALGRRRPAGRVERLGVHRPAVRPPQKTVKQPARPYPPALDLDPPPRRLWPSNFAALSRSGMPFHFANVLLFA